MSTDEQFTRHLRERIDAVGPAITVDTSGVIRGARRHRAIVRSGAATAAVTAVALVGWVAAAQPFTTATGYAPADPGTVATPSATPTDPADVGWPDAAYWYSSASIESTGPTEISENWYGHTKPGLIVADGDLSTAAGMGPALWGVLMIDGAWVQITWDELYALPTDPTALEQILRASVEPDRGTGSDDDKVVGFAIDLLRRSPAAPPLRRALWTIIEGVPGSVLTPGQSDSTGRPGSVLERSGEAESAGRYVFDPADGSLLELVRGDYRETSLTSNPASTLPKEPTLEDSGCASWATC